MENSSLDSSSESSRDSGLMIVSFVLATETRRLSYRDLHQELHSAFSEDPRFQSGFLLDTLERGVGHPVLHVKSVSTEDQFQNDAIKSRADNQYLTIRQGLYKEIQHIIADSSCVGNEGNVKKSSGYIVLGFKRFEGSMIDNTWRDWSGARFIYLNLDDMFQATRIALYQRLQPGNDIELFNYLLLVHCANLTDENIPALLDFVQRLRVKKVGAYVAAYEVTR